MYFSVAYYNVHSNEVIEDRGTCTCGCICICKKYLIDSGKGRAIPIVCLVLILDRFDFGPYFSERL